MRALVSAIDYAKGLHTIRLVGLRRGSTPLLSKDSMIGLVRAVQSAKAISTLDLSDDALDDAIAAQQLQALLAQSNGVSSLVLAHNALGVDSGKMMLAALEGNKVLRCLDVSCNPRLAEWPSMAKDLERMVKTTHTPSGLTWSLADHVALSLVRVLIQIPGRCEASREGSGRHRACRRHHPGLSVRGHSARARSLVPAAHPPPPTPSLTCRLSSAGCALSS